jgi:hypothetical protein
MLAIAPLHHILCKATEQGRIQKLWGRASMIPTSFYADDAVIFMAPINHDINFLTSTLEYFGDVSGLVTNCTKSDVAPIRCVGLDHDDILQAFLATHTMFPVKYLGLPLSVKRIKRIHFQPLEDKVATKLVPWIGKHVTMASRTSLVKSVLTSIIVYYITILNIPVEVLLKIDSI